MKQPLLGEIVTCAVTGKQFVIAKDGDHTMNYAIIDDRIVSDEGVIEWTKAEINAKRPVSLYISSDENHVTTWKGAAIGRVISRSPAFKNGVRFYQIRTPDGQEWYGRSQGGSMSIYLRPYK